MLETNSSKLLARVAVLAAVLLAAFWYWSPYWDMRQMAAAARAGDADTFNAYVDYSRLRENVKGQLAAKMAEEIRKVDTSNPFSAVGAAIGMGMVTAIVDAMVRPEVVMKAMADGKLALGKAGRAISSDPNAGSKPSEPTWEFERKGVNRIVSYAIEPGHADLARTQRVGFVFDRTGFASWKLTEVRLPNL